jgi:uncharacterized membrane protein YbhN (UPF0104 family)
MSIAERLRKLSIPRAVIRPLRYLPMLILLGLAVHLLLPQITALEHSVEVIEAMALWAVILALLAQAVSYVGLGYLMRAAAGLVHDRLPLLRSTLIGVAASDIGLVAGGAVGSAAGVYRWYHGSGVSKEGSLLAGSLPSLFNNLLLALIAMAGLIHLLIAHDLSTFQAVAFATILLILGSVIGGLAWGMQHRPALAAFAERASARWAALRKKPHDPAQTQETMERLFATWDSLKSGGWRRPLLGAALNIGFDMLTLYFIFVAARHAVSPGVLLAGYGLPLLLGKVGFLPGGVGIVEGTMAALYDGLGVPDPVTVVVILAYRAISFWLPTLLGLPLIPYLQHVTRSVRLSEEVNDVSPG